MVKDTKTTHNFPHECWRGNNNHDLLTTLELIHSSLWYFYCKATLLTLSQPLHSVTWVVSVKIVFTQSVPRILTNGLIQGKVQDSPFVFPELYVLLVGPLLQILKVPLSSSTTVHTSTVLPSFRDTFKLAAAASQFVIQVTYRGWIALAFLFILSIHWFLVTLQIKKQ